MNESFIRWNGRILRIFVLVLIIAFSFVTITTSTYVPEFTAHAEVATLAVAGSVAIAVVISSMLIANGMKFGSVGSANDIANDFWNTASSSVKSIISTMADAVAAGATYVSDATGTVVSAIGSYLQRLFPASDSFPLFTPNNPGYITTAPYFVSPLIPVISNISDYEVDGTYDFNSLPIFTDYSQLTNITCGEYGTFKLLAISCSSLNTLSYYVTDGTQIISYVPEMTNEMIRWQVLSSSPGNNKHWGWTIEMVDNYNSSTSTHPQAFRLLDWSLTSSNTASFYTSQHYITWPADSAIAFGSSATGFTGNMEYFPTGTKSIDIEAPVYIPTGALTNPEVLTGIDAEAVRSIQDLPLDDTDSEGTITSDGSGEGIFGNIGRFILNIPILGSILRALISGFQALQSLLERIIEAIGNVLDGIIEGITNFWNGIPNIIRSIKNILDDILSALRNILAFFTDFLADILAFIPTIISLITGYALYQALIDHFLPAPLAAVCWCFYLATVAIWIFRLILDR